MFLVWNVGGAELTDWNLLLQDFLIGPAGIERVQERNLVFMERFGHECVLESRLVAAGY